MKIYLIKSNYEYEIEAENKVEALEKWHEIIEEELALGNETISSVFSDSLWIEELTI